MYGYTADVYGFAAGDEDLANIVIDAEGAPNGGVRIRQGTSVYAQLAAGLFTLGLPGGNRVAWDGATLVVQSQYLTIDNSGIRLAPNQNTSNPWADDRRICFTVTNGEFGMTGYSVADPGSSRAARWLYESELQRTGE